MTHQDHLTKYVLFEPLKPKRTEEIAAYNLLDVFYTTFGAPATPHSDNGKRFVNRMITEFHVIWGYVDIVHGKHRHG